MKIDLPPELEGEYTVRVMDMPTSSPGFIICDEGNHYNIYLNARYTRESNAETAVHELIHAINDDFTNAEPIQTVESRASACRGAVAAPALPPLLRARDLLPLQKPSPEGEGGSKSRKRSHPSVSLTPRQTAVLLRAINDLDKWMFSDPAT